MHKLLIKIIYNRKAFTLMEMMIVLAVIILITGGISVAIFQARERANNLQRLDQVSQIRSALQLYKQENGFFPPALVPGQALVSPSGKTYLNEVPHSIKTGPCQDEYIYLANTTGANYALNYCLSDEIDKYAQGVCTASSKDLCCNNETNPAFCSRAGANCGTVTAADACGLTRSVDCGSCSGNNTCGGGGVPNTCGCPVEDNAAFCTRVAKECGSVTGVNNCGQNVTVDCGTCGGGGICDATNICQVPGCAMGPFNDQPTPASLDSAWQDLAYGQYNGSDVWVAVANGADPDVAVMTSYDNGVTWDIHTAPYGEWNSVAYGAGLFVAVGAANGYKVMTSPDGINWTARAVSLGSTWNDVEYLNGYFYAVGNSVSPTIMRSSDGISWNTVYSGGSGTWNQKAVAYGNSNVLSVGTYNATIQYFLYYNGSSWNQRNNPLGWGSSTNDVVFGNGYFVVVGGSSGSSATSSDGVSWRANNGNVGVASGNVTYGNGIFVAAGSDSIKTSTDAITWTTRTVISNSWQDVKFDNNQFVAVANPAYTNATLGTWVATSPNGIDWTTRNLAYDLPWQSVAAGNGKVVALANRGADNTVKISSDNGDTWTQLTGVPVGTWKKLVYGNGMFVAYGSTATNNVMYSSNGTNWTAITLGSGSGRDIAYLNNKFMAYGDDKVWFSTDGINWTGGNAISGGSNTNSFAYGKGMYVNVYSNSSATSSDGINWTRYNQTNSFSNVVFARNKFFATLGSDIYSSNDGITWTLAYNSSYSIKRLYFGGNRFVALPSTAYNKVITSEDGVTWTVLDTPLAQKWTDVVYADNRFVYISDTGSGRRAMINDCPQ
jgi:prepilin-type N-terminal cleavage/methylation domain-containing protein